MTPRLTPKDYETLAYIRSGKSPRQIALLTSRSIRTVEGRVQRIAEKLPRTVGHIPLDILPPLTRCKVYLALTAPRAA